ncbi:Microtubule-associated protein 70-1 [Senna tora]|uniref:Microtubule-associated protein 70-1 n=1 Tax=Senna tora TaxID=362788 RepID=A0A834TD71_9FABA|nr:Microtubule-associated protein 70-1 [Senna tora]
MEDEPGIFQPVSLALGSCFVDHQPKMPLPEQFEQFSQPQEGQPPLICLDSHKLVSNHSQKPRPNIKIYLHPSQLELCLQRSDDGFNRRHFIIFLSSMDPSKSGFCSKLCSRCCLFLIIDFFQFKPAKLNADWIGAVQEGDDIVDFRRLSIEGVGLLASFEGSRGCEERRFGVVEFGSIANVVVRHQRSGNLELSSCNLALT